MPKKRIVCLENGKWGAQVKTRFGWSYIAKDGGGAYKKWWIVRRDCLVDSEIEARSIAGAFQPPIVRILEVK